MTRQHVIRPGATLIQPYTIPEQRLPIDKPVVQYIRQSSRKQRKHNKASSDMQDVNMRNNLLAMKWTPELILPAIVTDTGMSGTKRADEREGLTQLYWLIDTGGVGTVAAHNVSRIYRALSKAETGKFCDLVLERGVPVVTSRRVYWPNRDDNKALAADFQAAADYIEDHVKGVMIAAKNYKIETAISYGGNCLPLGFLLASEEYYEETVGEMRTRQFYVEYEPHAALVRWLFRRFRELSGNLALLAHELKAIDFRFPAFPADIAPHVGLKADEDGSYPLRNRSGLMSILLNRAYISWYVYNGVVVSKEFCKQVVPMDDFLYSWERLSGTSLDGTQEQERIARERRYGGASALLDGVMHSGELPVYVVRNRYTARIDNNGFGKDELVVPLDVIDNAFGLAMVGTLLAIELDHRDGLSEDLYQRVQTLQKEEERKAEDYTRDIARIDKQIRSEEMAQRVSKGEGDENGYRDATRQLVLLRRDRAAIEEKQVHAGTEASELAECYDLLDCAREQWDAMPVFKRKKLVHLLVGDANMTEASPHFLRIDAVLNEPVVASFTMYVYRPQGSRLLWTNEENDLLRRMYPVESKQAIMTALPVRSWDAVKRQADDKGLVRAWQDEDTTPKDERPLCLEDYQIIDTTGAMLNVPALKVNTDESVRLQDVRESIPGLLPTNILSRRAFIAELKLLVAA